MLRLPAFRFLIPKTLTEAASMLSGEGAGEGQTVRLVAGGTDLWPNMKRRHQRASAVISLMRIPELRGIRNGSGLRLGATATLSEIAGHEHLRASFPALADAVGSISAPVLRNMGTIGGNVCLDTRCTYYNQNEEWRRAIDYCMKEAGTVCWVAPGSPRCWAISASDSAPMLCALEATASLISARGERELPISALYRDDGIDYLTKQPDEILTTIRVPSSSSAAHCRSRFLKLRRRGSIDFAVLDVAAALWIEPEGVVRKARLWLGAVASLPTEVDVKHLEGKPLDGQGIALAMKAARRAATPMDNTDFQAQWRGAMVEAYAGRALRELSGKG